MKRSLGMLLAVVAMASSLAAGAAEEYVVLQVAPAVSKDGSVAWQTKIGAKIYFDEMNVRGGVGGHQIKFLTVDEGSDISAQVRELVKEHQPAALFGTIGAAPVTKLLADKVLDGAQLPLVGARTGATALVAEKNNSWLFFTRPSYATEVEKVLKQFGTIGIHKAVVFYSDDAAGREILDQVKAVAAKQGQSVEAAISAPKDLSKIAAIADSVVQKDHQAVLMAVDAGAAAAFLKRYREQGGAAQVVAMSPVEAVMMSESAGAKAARGTAVVQVAPNPRNDAIAVVREFTTNYRKYGPYTEEPTQAMMEGYLAAKVLVEGLKRGGGGRAALARGISGMSSYDVGGVQFSFSNASRSGSKYIEMSVVDREGRIVR